MTEVEVNEKPTISKDQTLQTNALQIETAHTILENMKANPSQALSILLSAPGIQKSRVHIILDLIEEKLYGENELQFLKLKWSAEHRKRIHDHIGEIKEKFIKHYGKEQAEIYMNAILAKLFPDFDPPGLQETIQTFLEAHE